MLITCPGCATNFSIPDSALGTTGRKLKCAKCGHKWHQEPLMVAAEDDSDFDLSGSSFSAPPREAARFEAPPPPPPPPPPPRPVLVARDPAEDVDLDSPPVPDFGRRISPERSNDDPAAGLLDDEPQPIPDIFATPSSGGRKGTGFLWLLLILLIFGGLGGAGYYFQDQVIEMVPEAADLLGQVGLRREKPGAGLELRKAGTPERFVHNDTDVLVVRGIIANVTDRVRPVPTMKLVLLDKNKQPVQEKMSQPPVSALDPQGTASFKIVLERPDPNAVEVVVVFVDSGEAKPMPPVAAKAPAPIPAPPPAVPAPDVPPVAMPPAATPPVAVPPAAAPPPAAPGK